MKYEDWIYQKEDDNDTENIDIEDIIEVSWCGELILSVEQLA